MITQPRYISQYTGQQIDTILTSVSTKIDQSSIIDGFTSDSIVNPLSANSGRILYNSIVSLSNPSYLQSIFLSIPNNNLFTDALKSKLVNISDNFKGTYADAATRDSILSGQYLNYTGNELVVLLDDGSVNGLQAFQRWDVSTSSWKNLILYDLGFINNLVVSASSNVNLSTLNLNAYSTCKMLVTATRGTDIQTEEILISAINGNSYVTSYAHIGTTQSLFSYSTSIASNILTLTITTNNTNTTLKARKLCQI